MTAAGAPPTGPLDRAGPLARAGLLLAASAPLVAGLEWLGFPAALLIGPMLAGIGLAVAGGGIRLPRPLYLAAQALIGLLVGRAITPAILKVVAGAWPLFLGLTASVLVASFLLGLWMSRSRLLPGTVAIWGTSPGGASAMMLLAEAYGADARLVAVMQYCRVVTVVLAASLMTHLFVHAGAGAVAARLPEPVGSWRDLVATLGLAVGGALAGRLLRLPAGAMLVPMLAGAGLQGFGWLTIDLPPWLMGPSYAVVGWSIGLGFTRGTVLRAVRALPRIVASILVLVAFCGGLAVLLTRLFGIDPLTAYLATSPGGMDSVAILAAASPVDMPFVMAVQAMRFLAVLAAGPSLARFAVHFMRERDR